MSRLKQILKRVGYGILVGVVWVSVLSFFVWAIGALYYFLVVPYSLRVLLAIAYVLGVWWLWRRVEKHTRWLSVVAGSIVVIYVITLVQRPSNQRDWVKEQRLMSIVDVTDGRVTIDNFRHSEYRSEIDFDVGYRTISFPLNRLNRVWFLVQKFSAVEGLAHTFLSFEIETDGDPEYFSVSVEIRREWGEVYSPIRGLYRQFELMYVIGDERDLIGLRTNIREHDRVHMYQANATPQQVQQLFLDIVGRIKKLERKPQFYHTLLNNCTNGIVLHTYKLTPEPINWLDPRIVLPGYSDRFAYANRLIGRDGQSFEELRTESRIDEVAREVGLTEEFSVGIRKR